MKRQPNFLILSGDGINCEILTRDAFLLAGARARIVHINELLQNKTLLKSFDGLAVPGGFSFGDELGSGQILALKISHYLGEEFQKFLEGGKPVIGICNGFQVLVKLGLLPDGGGRRDRVMALGHNSSGSFINRWVDLEVVRDSVCIWTRALSREGMEEDFSLPIRHGEGRVIFSDPHISQSLAQKGQIPLRYRQDINGSQDRIAGVCDPTGKIFGLMPHPEAYLYELLHPVRGHRSGRMQKGLGTLIFESAVNFLKEN